MNEQQLKVLENWIAAERAVDPAMSAARKAAATPQDREAALSAFQKACDCAGVALNIIKSVFGPLS